MENNKVQSGFIDEEILIRAINKWGANAQIEMIKEECMELALAIQKLSRERGDWDKKYEDVIDEIADVKIMIKQADKLFDAYRINKRVDYKMQRLESRLTEGLS